MTKHPNYLEMLLASRKHFKEAKERIARGEHPDCEKCGTRMDLDTKPHHDSDQLYHPPVWVCPKCGHYYNEEVSGSYNPPPEDYEKGKVW